MHYAFAALLGMVGGWGLVITISDIRSGWAGIHAWWGLISWYWWTEQTEEHSRAESPLNFWLVSGANLAFHCSLLAVGFALLLRGSFAI